MLKGAGGIAALGATGMLGAAPQPALAQSDLRKQVLRIPGVGKGSPTDADWQYEPKWDGFRCLAVRRGQRVDLWSKSGQPLARYFPEVVERLKRLRANRVSGFVGRPDMSMPRSAMTRTAFGCSCLGWLPALRASTAPTDRSTTRASAPEPRATAIPR